MHISEIHPSYVMLHFPLLIPTGQSGWHTELQCAFTHMKGAEEPIELELGL
jgi:hypothetical protein